MGRGLRRIAAQLEKAVLRLRLGERWRPADDTLSRRVYPDYATYLAHQSLKLDAHRASSLAAHDRRFASALGERLGASGLPLSGRTVLCLAARSGAEVRAFREHGAAAVGIDLNPGPDNPWVVRGDFHALAHRDGSVDLIYMNSLDHVFDLDALVREIRRVLREDGIFLAEIGPGTDEGGAPGFYEALTWRTADALVERIAAAGFREEMRTPFHVPWEGVQSVLRKRR